MKLFDVATGVVAGALVVLGISQGVNSFQVGKELGAKQEMEKRAYVNQWFVVETSTTGTPPTTAQRIVGQITGGPQSPCDAVDGRMCAVQLAYEFSPAIETLLDRIGSASAPTVAEFVAAGATVQDYAFNSEGL